MATLAFTAEPVHGLTASLMPAPLPAAAGFVLAAPVQSSRLLPAVPAGAVVASLALLSLPHDAATSANATAATAKRADGRILVLMFSPLAPTTAEHVHVVRFSGADRLPHAWVSRSRTIASSTILTPAGHAITHLQVRFREAAERLEPQRAAADQTGDDHGRQHHQDHLVDAEHDRLERQRQLHLDQFLARRGPERDRRLAWRERHLLEPEADQADARRKGVDHRGDHARRAADVEQEDHGDEVDELRQHLGGVEERAQRALQPPGAAGPDADRHGEADADDTATSTWLRVSIARSQLCIAAMPTKREPAQQGQAASPC